jgi:hypothetical protein
MPQFFCFYRRVTTEKEKEKATWRRRNENFMVVPPFFQGKLQKYVSSGSEEYVLRIEKEAFWRTYNQSEMNGESFYYQQIVTKRCIFNTTFEKDRGDYRTWKG